MPRDVHILEYKKKASFKTIWRLEPEYPNESFLYVIFEKMWVCWMCVLFKTLIFRFS